MAIGFLAFACILQWLAIWAAIAKIEKQNKEKRAKELHKLICTMGVPAILGLLIGVGIYFTSIPNFVSAIIFVALDVIFLFCGASIAKKVFKKDYEKKKSTKTNGNQHKKKKKRK